MTQYSFLAKALATSFTVERTHFDDSYSKLLEQNDARLLVAIQGDRLVGYCLAFEHLTFFANGLVTWVEEVMVLEQSRECGIGRKLMLEIERWAIERNSTMIALATRRAEGFYEAVGYTKSATYFRKKLKLN